MLTQYVRSSMGQGYTAGTATTFKTPSVTTQASREDIRKLCESATRHMECWDVENTRINFPTPMGLVQKDTEKLLYLTSVSASLRIRFGGKSEGERITPC